MSSPEIKGGNTGRFIAIAIGGVLVVALAFFMYKYYTEKGKNEQAEITVDELTTEIEDLEVDLEDYQSDLENKDMELEEKERLLTEKVDLLAEKQKRIDQLLKSNKISKTEAEKLKGKVEQLEFYIKRYQTEIAELKKKVNILESENNALTSKIDTISGKMSKLEMAKLATEVKLEAASILKAYSFKYFRFRGNDKPIQETEFRRSQLDKLMIKFDLMENTAAEAGPRNVFLQIKNPKGKVIMDVNGQSGYFDSMGDDYPYTIKKEVNYSRATTPVAFTFAKPENLEFDKGKHTVVVFCDGYDIATSSFLVK